MSKGWGPGYTVADLVYYMGFIGGAVAAGLTLRMMGYDRLWQLIAAIVGGIVLGIVCDQAFQRMRQPPRGPGDGHQGGPPRPPGGER